LNKRWCQKRKRQSFALAHVSPSDCRRADLNKSLPGADHYSVEDIRRDRVGFQLADVDMPLSTVAVIADFQWSNVLDVVTELHTTETSGAIGLNPHRSSRSGARMARNTNVYARHGQTTFL